MSYPNAYLFPAGRRFGAMALPRHNYPISSTLFGGASPGVVGFPGVGLGSSLYDNMVQSPGVPSPSLLELGGLLNAYNSNQLATGGLLPATDRHHLEVERLLSLRRQALLLSSGMSGQPTGSTHPVAGLSMIEPPPLPPALLATGLLDDATVLEALGRSMRRTTSPYIDAAGITDRPSSEEHRARGGVTEPFPEKLHRMLSEIDNAGNADIASFYPHGRAFGIHDQDRFVREIMPKYFKQTRLSSFLRQLNLYGFTRIVLGPDAGGYFHELFLKGRPTLCAHMRRVGVPHGNDRRKLKKEPVMKKEPNFYAMEPIE